MLRTWAEFLIVLAVAAVPLGLIVVGVDGAAQVRQRQTWPTAAGTVLSADLVDRTDRSLIIRLRYRYEVDGATHEAIDQIGRPRTYEQIAEFYLPGSPIDVLYDPAAPARSALEVGDHGPTVFYVVVGAIGLLILSPLLAFYTALLFAELMLLKARYHLRQGQQALAEGLAAVERSRNADGRLPAELADRQAALLEQASAAEALVRQVERELQGAAPPAARPDVEFSPWLGRRWFWRRVLAGLAAYAAAWGVALLGQLLLLMALLLFVAVAAGICGAVAAGIWIGQRMVERGRRGQANLLGWSLVVCGALTFGWFASRSQQGYWETIPHGELIGWTGVLAGLGWLLFGLGVAKRHSRKPAPIA